MLALWFWLAKGWSLSPWSSLYCFLSIMDLFYPSIPSPWKKKKKNYRDGENTLAFWWKGETSHFSHFLTDYMRTIIRCFQWVLMHVEWVSNFVSNQFWVLKKLENQRTGGLSNDQVVLNPQLRFDQNSPKWEKGATIT